MRGSRYVPVSRLGGGRSEVWLGVLDGAAGFRRPVVLKIARDPAARDELAREGRVAASLRHPSVVPVQDLFESEGALVLVMDHVSGTTLHSLLAHLRAVGGRVPWAVGARIVADAARGLAHAHAATDAWGQPLGLVHRDVSPSNLLVGEDGRTLVADFGIARSRFSEATAHGLVQGTPGYLSPEQAAGRPLDGRSDVFSLGAVLFGLVWGEPLADPSQPGASLARIAREGLRAAPSDVPAAVADVARRMLVFDAARRAIDMDAVADALEALAVGGGGGHREVRTFLQAELGEVLARRRRRLADLLEGSSAPDEPEESWDASTMILLEAQLDGAVAPDRTPGFGSFAPIEEEDPTEIDGR